ncbi:MAG: UDP-N-acetylglucosamine 1-carboxyvinyltransferase [Thermodesulfobacteriota bacterium]
MDEIIIEGGQPLNGTIQISGAKNAALPLMAATLLCAGEHTLTNVPDLRDVRTMLALMETLGASYSWLEPGTLRVNSDNVNNFEASYELVKTMRASVLVLGPLLARLGRARVSLPGGCAIGARPINFHTQGLEALGVVNELSEGYVDSTATGGGLQGGRICFDLPSVTGTENMVMAACLAKGQTIITNAAREPEVGNLIDMLSGMGARISGRGTGTLIIDGVTDLNPCETAIIPDRIETGTYIAAVGVTGGELELTCCNPSHLPSFLGKMRSAGILIEEKGDKIVARSNKNLTSVDVKTMPFPGFATDLQAQVMAMMVYSKGLSVIDETIFENRFMHVAELQRLGADIRVEGGRAIVAGLGPGQLVGAPVMATDLRASASLVIAGLAAQGRTTITRVYHLDRGYERLAEKLQGVGAKIWRQKG